MIRHFHGGILKNFGRIYCSCHTFRRSNKSCNMSKEEFQIIKEGKAEVLFSKDVFYNPVQEFNRDLSVSVIRHFTEELLQSRGITVSYDENSNNCSETKEESSETQGNGKKEYSAHPGKKCLNGVKLLEALSASGLRSIRYAKEIPGIERIVANDIAEEAVSAMKRNIKHNNLDQLVEASQADAVLLMYQNPKQYDVIDLDPYGSAGPFIDPAVHSISAGGLLCVTCTDMSVMCGNYGETCFTKYGAFSIKATYSHEMALRILLYAIQASAIRCGRYIEPLLSISVDFYIRVFVRIHNGQAEAKHAATNTAIAYVCTYCENFAFQRFGEIVTKPNGNPKFSAAHGPPVSEKCDNCGSRYHMAGPMWAEPIHNVPFVTKVLNHVNKYSHQFNTQERLKGLLSVVSEEVPDGPLYYPVSKFCNFIHCICPPQVKVRSAILNAGYKVSSTHCSAEGIKTDAPPSVIWDILRAWVKENPVKREKLVPQVIHILQKTPSTAISFELHPDAKPQSKKLKLRRFQQNPEKYWGPKKRAIPGSTQESLPDRKHRLQGKRARQEESPQDEEKMSTSEEVPKADP